MGGQNKSNQGNVPFTRELIKEQFLPTITSKAAVVKEHEV